MRRRSSLSKFPTAPIVDDSNNNSDSTDPTRLPLSSVTSGLNQSKNYNFQQQQQQDSRISTTSLLPEERPSMPNNHNQLYLLDSAPSSSVSTSSFLSNGSIVCRCCGQQNCDNVDYYVDIIRKLESDTRLAAEIGQGLLHKHETFVNESNQQRTQLQQQLNECHERIIDLEHSLDEMEQSKEDVTKEKNKWLWEYQKLQKILDETIADLEIANDRCTQLSNDIQAKNTELEKLRVYKYMARHSETREEALTAKLEDTNQELAIRKKNELILEAKVKKLQTRYDRLHANHEKLARQMEQRVLATQALLAGNTDEQNATANVSTKSLSTISTEKDNNHTSDFIHIIRELSAANSKLKTDLMNCKEQLSEAQEEIVALTLDKRLQEDLMLSPSLSTSSLNTHHEHSTGRLSSSNKTNPKPIKMEGETMNDLLNLNDNSNHSDDSNSQLRRATHQSHSKDETLNRPLKQPEPKPTISTSTVVKPCLSMSPLNSATASEGQNAIVHHHHYHYYLNNKEGEEQSSNCTTMQQQQETNQRESHSMAGASPLLHESREVASVQTPSAAKSPYTMLQEHVTQIMDRIRGSDIRALNRRLKRTFDMSELSSMSNSIIENILVDIDTLDSRFLWLKPAVVADLPFATSTSTTILDYQHMDAFFSFLNLVQDMLRELGVLKTTMNDLQVVYVKKVEEDELRVQEEVLKKRQLRRRDTVNMPSLSKSASTMTVSSTSTTRTARPLSWFTNMFSRSSLVNDDDMSCDSSVRSNVSKVSHSIQSPSLLPQDSPSTFTALAQHQHREQYNEHASSALQNIVVNDQSAQDIIRSTSDTTPLAKHSNVRLISNTSSSSSKPSMSTTIDSIYHTSFSRSTLNQQQQLNNNTNKRRSLSSFFSANAMTPSRSSSLSALSASFAPHSASSSSHKTKRKDIPSTFETDYKSFETSIPSKDHSGWKVMNFAPHWLNNPDNHNHNNK